MSIIPVVPLVSDQAVNRSIPSPPAFHPLGVGGDSETYPLVLSGSSTRSALNLFRLLSRKGSPSTLKHCSYSIRACVCLLSLEFSLSFLSSFQVCFLSFPSLVSELQGSFIYYRLFFFRIGRTRTGYEWNTSSTSTNQT